MHIFHPYIVLLMMGLTARVEPGHFALFPKGNTFSGKYHPHTRIVAEGKACGVDSAAGTVLRFDQVHKNPLFESKSANMTHLLLWFQDSIQADFRYQLPHPRIVVCYWEQGDLLMFHTSKAIGWIEFEGQAKPKKLRGKMEIKLVEPDHNMSNSDYHFMGGVFVAQETRE